MAALKALLKAVLWIFLSLVVLLVGYGTALRLTQPDPQTLVCDGEQISSQGLRKAGQVYLEITKFSPLAWWPKSGEDGDMQIRGQVNRGYRFDDDGEFLYLHDIGESSAAPARGQFFKVSNDFFIDDDRENYGIKWVGKCRKFERALD